MTGQAKGQWSLRYLSVSGIHNFKALFVLLQSFQCCTCLQNFSQLFLMICCHMSNVICVYTPVKCVKLALSCSKDQTPQRQLKYCWSHYTLLLVEQPFWSLFLPKSSSFLYLSVYVSDFPHHLISHHFIPNILLFTSSYYDLKPAFISWPPKWKRLIKKKKEELF